MQLSHQYEASHKLLNYIQIDGQGAKDIMDLRLRTMLSMSKAYSHQLTLDVQSPGSADRLAQKRAVLSNLILERPP